MTYLIKDSTALLKRNAHKEDQIIKAGIYETPIEFHPQNEGWLLKFKKMIKSIIYEEGTYGEIPPSMDEITKIYNDYIKEIKEKSENREASNPSNTN